MPITSATFEMGQFDTQVLKAVAEGRPLPEGTDYQQGERYGSYTLREAVFKRDNYTCIICGRSAFRDNVRLHEHHVGFWRNDRSNRMANLGTVCHICHTSRNHKPGGKLYGLEPKLAGMTGATFMTMVRFDMFAKLKTAAPDVRFHMTYGTKTKLSRQDLGIRKTHANDAWAMGQFHPRYRTDTVCYKKFRRNSRILEKFYDAKYVDIRDGQKKSGSQLSCNRTNRKFPRNNPENLRIYHGQKLSDGKRVIRTARYPIQPGDRVMIAGQWYITTGMHNKGTRLIVDKKSIAVKNIQQVIHSSGWIVT